MQTSQILTEIKRSVYSIDPDATLILFGSYARGDYHEGSDIDILVLLSKERITLDDRLRIGAPLYHLEVNADIHISPRIYSKSAWNTKLNITPFYQNVAKEGIRL